jgi:hypothetical protein
VYCNTLVALVPRRLQCEDYYQRIPDFGGLKILFEIKVLDGERDTCKSDNRLAKTVANAFDQAEKQFGWSKASYYFAY